MLWLCLYMPQLGLELFTRSLPDGAAGRPVVLGDGQRVVQLNALARSRGLRVQMSLSTAHGICSDLTVVARDADAEARTLAQLGHWAGDVTPQVSLAPPDGLLLEVGGSLRLFRGLDRLQQRLLGGLQTLGYSTVVGLGSTPLMAQLLARCGRTPAVQQLLEQLDPGPGDGGLRQAWSEAVDAAARRLLPDVPLACLDQPAALLERMQAMGLHRYGQLAALPRAPLGRRFGAALLEHLDRLEGRRPDPRTPLPPGETFQSTLHFLEDVEQRQALAFPMQRLGRELAAWLQRRQLGTDRLSWRLAHPRQGQQIMQVRFARPQHTAERLLEFSRLQLERIELPAAVASLTLAVRHAQRRDQASQTLFEGDRAREDPGTLVDLLRARFGADVCMGLEMVDDHRPERAWRGVLPQPRTRQPRQQAPTAPPGPRPLWLLQQPRPLACRHGQPLYRGPLQLCRGPERIEIGWWDLQHAAAPRDYWVARHARGAHFWVFRALDSDRWFLHGVFG